MNDDIDITEFKVEEWRLKRELEVEEFRMPPDYRMKNRYQNVPNAEIVVPLSSFSALSLLSILRSFRGKNALSPWPTFVSIVRGEREKMEYDSGSFCCSM